MTDTRPARQSRTDREHSLYEDACDRADADPAAEPLDWAEYLDEYVQAEGLGHVVWASDFSVTVLTNDAARIDIAR